jgi:hypothetical protein
MTISLLLDPLIRLFGRRSEGRIQTRRRLEISRIESTTGQLGYHNEGFQSGKPHSIRTYEQ